MEPGKLQLMWHVCCKYCTISRFVIDGRVAPGAASLEAERLGWVSKNNAWICKSCLRQTT